MKLSGSNIYSGDISSCFDKYTIEHSNGITHRTCHGLLCIPFIIETEQEIRDIITSQSLKVICMFIAHKNLRDRLSNAGIHQCNVSSALFGHLNVILLYDSEVSCLREDIFN
jgi:hypothetical protein